MFLGVHVLKFLFQTIDYGYTLESHQSGGSNVYHIKCFEFSMENHHLSHEKNTVYSVDMFSKCYKIVRD